VELARPAVRLRQSAWSRALLWLALWAGIGLLTALQFYFAWKAEYGVDGKLLTFQDALIRRMPGWLLWGVFAIGIARLARAFPFGRRRGGTLRLHVAVSLVVAVLHAALRIPIEFMPMYMAEIATEGSDVSYFDVYWVAIFWYLPPGIVMYWAILAVCSALHYRERLSEKEIQAATLEAKLSEARLSALKMQLQPHFLFNTLHSVAALARTGRGDEVVRVVSGLSDLLRHVLSGGGRQLVRLEEEMDLVDRYLEIEGLRFQDRLRVTRVVAPDVLSAMVPNLILQPLVENAIRHGISVAPKSGRVEVRASRQGEQLVLEVRDDGPGPGGPPVGGGIGLSNVRERLHELYGEAARFELVHDTWGETGGSGSCARIRMPFDETGQTEKQA
jgi:two-component system, LytTR family, sensor kinase